MTTEKINGAYKLGYRMGREELEEKQPEKVGNEPLKAVKELIREFKDNEDVWDGIIAAEVDYAMGNEWEF